MLVNIEFDNQAAVASISLEGWAQPLVEFLAQYFTIHNDMLHLDYSHLLAENLHSPDINWLFDLQTERERFMREFEDAAQQGQIALTLKISDTDPLGLRSRPLSWTQLLTGALRIPSGMTYLIAIPQAYMKSLWRKLSHVRVG